MATDDVLGAAKEINRELKEAENTLKRINGNMSGGAAGSGGRNLLSGALGNVSAGGSASVAAAARYSNIMTGVGMAGGVVSGLASALPSVQGTVARAGGYYGAVVASGGGMSRRMLESVTFGGLKGGITSAGSDAAVASYLTGRGMIASGAMGSTYQQTLRGIGNAAKYLNMSNESAAVAIEGMTSGSMSAQMMNTYGIFTSNPRTGKEFTTGQIFEQMAQRFTAGQGKASVSDTLTSLRRGALGSNIRNSGLSTDQQAMFAQYMIERAKGNYMDLSDQKQMSAIMDKAKAEGNENPFAAAYRIASAETGAMGKAEENYLKAISDATPLIEKMNAAAGEMATSFLGYAKAYAAALGGSQASAGVISAGGSLLSGVGDIATTALAAKALTGGGKGNLLGQAGKMAGKAGLIGAGAVVAGGSIASSYQSGTEGKNMDIWQILGATAGGAATGAGVGALGFTPFSVAGGALVGAGIGLAGALTGNVAGQAGKGGPSSGLGMGSTTDTSGSMLSRPVAGGSVSASYGEKGSIWSKGYHSGTDYAVPTGTPVYAAAAGTVSKAQKGSGDHSYGIYITIDHANGYQTLYGHLSQTIAKPGDVVTKGQIIAKSGESGHVTGPHLHFEVFKNGVSVDPSSLLSNVSAGSGNAGEDKAPSNGDSGSNVMGTVLGGSAGAPPLNVSWSGVKGNFITASSLVSASMSAGSGVYSPVVSATGASVSQSVASYTGGPASALGLGATSNMPGPGLHADAVSSVSNASSSRSSGAVVNIAVTVAQASESEARRLAELVKSYIEDDSLVGNISRR